MRALQAMVLAALLGWMVLGSARAEPDPAVSSADRDAIVGVIRDQMAAFRRDDAAAAFGFAAPTIQGMFDHDPEQFMAMVRHGYQPVYRPRNTQFGVIETVQGKIVQHVEVEGPDGVSRTALYTMEHQQDGSWRIGGCVLTDSGSVGA